MSLGDYRSGIALGRAIWPAVMVVCSCATSGFLNQNGYGNSTYPYRIAYTRPAEGRFLGPDWQVDSWTRGDPGGSWEQKTGEDYVAVREMDLDRDGTIGSGEQEKEPIYDLRLVSRTTNGVIWAKAHPLHPDNSDRLLDVVLDGYVDSLRGTGLYAQGNVFSLERIKTRKFTTFVTDRGAVQMGAHSGVTATIELAEVDRLQIHPEERSSKTRIVMVRFPYQVDADKANRFQRVCPEIPRQSAMSSASQKVTNPYGGKREAPPPAPPGQGQQLRCHALLVLGYYNTPDHFAAGLADFDAFVQTVTLKGLPPSPASGRAVSGTSLPHDDR